MKKALLIAAMLLVPTVPALAQVPEETPQAFTVQYDNDPEVCLLGQADVVCPEDTIVVQYGPDGHVYDARGNRYELLCTGSDALRLANWTCEWVRYVPPDQIVGEVQ